MSNSNRSCKEQQGKKKNSCKKKGSGEKDPPPLVTSDVGTFFLDKKQMTVLYPPRPHQGPVNAFLYPALQFRNGKLVPNEQ